MRRLASPRTLLLLLLPLAVAGANQSLCLPRPWEAAFDQVVTVAAGPDFETDFRTAVLTATPGTIIQLAPGRHVMNGTITVETSHVIVRGAGMVLPAADGSYDTSCPGSPGEHCGTVLDYLGQGFGSQGILVFGDHFAIEHLTILNTRGDGVKTQDTTGSRFAFVHVNWPDVPDLLDHGAYGLYPAEGVDVHVFACDVRGVRDAGIYVGQSDNIVVEYSHVAGNVIGIELENTKNGEVRYNVATGNTAGIAIFDLPNLKESYGTRVYRNQIFDNDTPNFAAGGIISLLPAGTGLIVIGSKDVEIFENDIWGNDTVNAVVASFQISLEAIDDPDYDPYATKVYLHHNRFGPGGGNPVQFGALVQQILQGFCASLPLAEAQANPGCQVPPSCNGGLCVQPVPPDIVFGGWIDPDRFLPDCASVADGEPCADAGLVPQLLRVAPQHRNCAQHNGDVLVATLNGFQGTQPGVDFYDASYWDCGHEPRLPVRIPDPTEPPDVDGGLTPEERDLLCEGAGEDATTVNWDAFAANCLYLDQYRLFQEGDPRGTPQDGGFGYDLTTPLFSDYADKDRFIFLPPDAGGERQPMEYSADGVFALPVGTIISKTFSFQDPDGGMDLVAETRLLIHRSDGWEGLPFIWNHQTGRAELAIAGGVIQDVAVRDPSGTTHVFDYPVPDMAQCGTCHFGATGDDPIGPKARLLNRPFGGAANQLVQYVAEGILVDGAYDALPASPTPAAFDRIPVFDDPADGTLEQRAKGYLESNCAHCHNQDGRAGFTSLHLTWDHPIDVEYGICKRPIAAGGGAFTDEFDARVDIEPGDHGRSILWRRMESADPAKMMPELSRVLVHQEGLDVVGEWIDLDLAPRAGECDLLAPPPQ